MKRRYRLEYGILKRYDVDGVYPDFRRKEPLIKRGAYYQLNAEFKEVIDLYQNADLRRGLKQRTVKSNVSCGACFLLAIGKIQEQTSIMPNDAFDHVIKFVLFHDLPKHLISGTLTLQFINILFSYIPLLSIYNYSIIVAEISL